MKIGALCALALGVSFTTARADTFGSGGNAFTIDFVTIGNPGNANDSGTTGSFFSPYGGVGYTFRMGTYEISEDMIAKANTLGSLGITKENRAADKPATFVTWNEAARFVNWLNTSQSYAPAYKFTLQPGDGGYTTAANIVLWQAGDPGYDASNPYRNSAAYYFLPSENEWYKAAYYSGSGTTYFDYATGSNTSPTAVGSGTGAGTVVYARGANPVYADITQAGGLSAYGTMGQNGNVWEWQESAGDGINSSPSENRTFRGGDAEGSAGFLRSSNRFDFADPWAYEDVNFGFRVASVVVPEPTSAALMATSLLGLLTLRRRRA